MEELQGIAAAVDVARLAWEGCKFFRKVQKADRIVAEVYERTSRLQKVLENVKLVLQAREERGVATRTAVEIQTEQNINDCVRACRAGLLEVRKKVGGFDLRDPSPALLDRVKVALRHPSVSSLQTDLEARVNALEADLLIIQLFVFLSAKSGWLDD